MRNLGTSKMRIPKVICDLILEYHAYFQIIWNLPSRVALRRLVRRSNNDIMERFLLEKMVTNNGAVSYTIMYHSIMSLLETPSDLHALFRAVRASLRNCMHSSALQWTFLNDTLHMRPEYIEIFQGSLIFQVTSYLMFRV